MYLIGWVVLNNTQSSDLYQWNLDNDLVNLSVKQYYTILSYSVYVLFFSLHYSSLANFFLFFHRSWTANSTRRRGCRSRLQCVKPWSSAAWVQGGRSSLCGSMEGDLLCVDLLHQRLNTVNKVCLIRVKFVFFYDVIKELMRAPLLLLCCSGWQERSRLYILLQITRFYGHNASLQCLCIIASPSEGRKHFCCCNSTGSGPFLHFPTYQ